MSSSERGPTPHTRGCGELLAAATLTLTLAAGLTWLWAG